MYAACITVTAGAKRTIPRNVVARAAGRSDRSERHGFPVGLLRWRNRVQSWRWRRTGWSGGLRRHMQHPSFTPLAPGGPDGQAEYDAHIRYYRLLRSSYSWQAAFKEAFGISVNDFYGVRGVPHGAIGAATSAPMTWSRSSSLQGRFRPTRRPASGRSSRACSFRERLGGGPVDYTVFVEDPAAAASIRPGLSAGARVRRLSSVVTWAATHRGDVRRLRSTSRGPRSAGAHGVASVRPRDMDRRGASWLDRGLLRYVETVSRVAVGGHP